MNSVLSFIFLTSTILSSITAHASLGDNENSINNDQKVFGASHSTSQATGYSVHLLKASTTTVREFISPSGSVFAVTWRGAAPPDFATLFGSHYQEFQDASAKAPKHHGRRAVPLTTSNIVVKRGGHMRDIHGMAYVPSLVPSGVNVETLP